MVQKTIPIIYHPNFTKFTALILGYSLWFFIATYQWDYATYTIPICFHQNINQQILSAETVMIKLYGPRHQMRFINPKNLAIHVDVTNFTYETHTIFLDDTNLFLPEPLKLVELIPSAISLQIQPNSKIE